MAPRVEPGGHDAKPLRPSVPFVGRRRAQGGGVARSETVPHGAERVRGRGRTEQHPVDQQLDTGVGSGARRAAGDAPPVELGAQRRHGVDEARVVVEHLVGTTVQGDTAPHGGRRVVEVQSAPRGEIGKRRAEQHVGMVVGECGGDDVAHEVHGPSMPVGEPNRGRRTRSTSVVPVQVVRSIDDCPGLAGSVVTIGAYDGVHRGHREVIRQVRELAGPEGLATVVVTFDRHPASVVRPESAPLLLCDLDQKLALLAETGVDLTMVVHFDDVRAKEPAEEFVSEVLVDCLRARAIVVGEDFHFGHQRRGNVELLRELGPRLGFDVAPVRLIGMDGAVAPAGSPKVSSTAIRAALRDGDLGSANSMLGRCHEVRGIVGRGDRRGRELGFPTANVEVGDEFCLPADGIYAADYVRPDGSTHPAAVSLGRRPTFYDDQPFSLLEAHLLDVDDPSACNLYGESARVRFVQRLRDEARFDSVDELVTQMVRDCDQARSVLAARRER